MKDSKEPRDPNVPSIIEFTFEQEFQVRTMIDTRTDTEYVCLSDLLKAMGSTTRTNHVLPELDEIFGKGYKIVIPLSTPGGTQDTIFICRDAAMFVIAKGRTETGKRLNKWIFAEVLPALRKKGTYSLPKPKADTGVKKLPVEVRDTFRCFRDIAKMCGFTGNQVVLSANNATRNMTGVDALAQMEQSHLIAPIQEIYFTPTQLGARFGVSGKKFNDALVDAGLSERVDSIVKPTAQGKAFAQILDTNKRHSGGAPVQQVKWSEGVLEPLALFFTPPTNGNGGSGGVQ